MHVVLELPASHPAEQVAATAATRGLALHTVSRYYAGPPTLNALIIGYGATPLSQLRRAAAELRGLLPARPDHPGSNPTTS
jgi:DNA-binding transcriptional MocR family regulator